MTDYKEPFGPSGERNAEPQNRDLAGITWNIDARDWYDERHGHGAYNELAQAQADNLRRYSFTDLEAISSRISDELAAALPGLQQLIADLTKDGQGIEVETGRTYGPNPWTDDDLASAVAAYFRAPAERRRKVSPFMLATGEHEDGISYSLHDAWQKLDAWLGRYAEMLARLEACRKEIERGITGAGLRDAKRKEEEADQVGRQHEKEKAGIRTSPYGIDIMKFALEKFEAMSRGVLIREDLGDLFSEEGDPLPGKKSKIAGAIGDELRDAGLPVPSLSQIKRWTGMKLD